MILQKRGVVGRSKKKKKILGSSALPTPLLIERRRRRAVSDLKAFLEHHTGKKPPTPYSPRFEGWLIEACHVELRKIFYNHFKNQQDLEDVIQNLLTLASKPQTNIFRVLYDKACAQNADLAIKYFRSWATRQHVTVTFEKKAKKRRTPWSDQLRKAIFETDLRHIVAYGDIKHAGQGVIDIETMRRITFREPDLDFKKRLMIDQVEIVVSTITRVKQLDYKKDYRKGTGLILSRDNAKEYIELYLNVELSLEKKAGDYWSSLNEIAIYLYSSHGIDAFREMKTYSIDNYCEQILKENGIKQ